MSDGNGLGVGQYARSKAFHDRVQFFLDQGEALVNANEKDVFIADEARVIAEILHMRLAPRREAFHFRQTIDTNTTDVQYFGTKQTAATLHTTNMPDDAKFPRQSIFFLKSSAFILDPTMSQADKQNALHNFLANIKMSDRIIVPRTKLRNMPSGSGLDGELNNGVPKRDNRAELPFFVRIPPAQTFDAILERKVAQSASKWIEWEIEGIYGTVK